MPKYQVGACLTYNVDEIIEVEADSPDQAEATARRKLSALDNQGPVHDSHGNRVFPEIATDEPKQESG